MASAHNAYVIANDSYPEVMAHEWPGFQDFIEDLALGLTGDISTKRNPPNPNVVQPDIVHEVRNMYGTKRKNCKPCRAKLGPRVRVPQTTLGCVYGCLQKKALLHTP